MSETIVRCFVGNSISGFSLTCFVTETGFQTSSVFLVRNLSVWESCLCCLISRISRQSTVISRLCSQLESELFVRTYVVGAKLAVVLLTALANRFWSLGLMSGDWYMLWMKLTILFGKEHSIHQHYAIHFTNNVRQSQGFNSVREIGIRLQVQTVKPSNWSKLTKHRMTVRSEAAVRKVCVKRQVMCKRSALNVCRNTKKLVRLSADLQSWMVRYFFGLIMCIEQTAPSTFTNHFESKLNCWTIISNRELQQHNVSCLTFLWQVVTVDLL